MRGRSASAGHRDALLLAAGVLAVRPGGYQPISGPPPKRERRDSNPLDWDEYLLRVLKHL